MQRVCPQSSASQLRTAAAAASAPPFLCHAIRHQQHTTAPRLFYVRVQQTLSLSPRRPPTPALPARPASLSTSPVMSRAAAAAEGGGGEMERSIVRKLTDAFHPSHLQVINESYQHSVPSGSETHFKVVVVSEQFSGQSSIARHRAVNAALSEEFKRGLHALSISAKTPQQWDESGGAVSHSPACLGGMKGEAASRQQQQHSGSSSDLR